ncbi:MAG TPA: chemotaxis-specific protein-glutamate methyltransferase CheB [Methylomirabilota bacterium]|nr:chemotaxis-specific protein-glutamate methyltransferase CheB [Methylomirabilota bacterium]
MTGFRYSNRRIRVLVVEDSRFMGSVIRQILASDPQIEVVGMAADGVEAVRAVAALAPTVVTMDVNMPHADGLVAVERIMAERPTPILMLSAYTRDGAAATIRALELGAVDFVTKPTGSVGREIEELRETLIRKVKMAARVCPVRNAAPTVGAVGSAEGAGRAGTPVRPSPSAAVACVVVAASTGGPSALLSVIPALPRELPASVLIVQHMPAPYTTQLARELSARSAVEVKEADAGEMLTPGVVYLAPGSRDLVVGPLGIVTLRPAPQNGGGCPSANLAMASVARFAGPLAVGLVLTGMGEDGAEGAAAIRRAGGRVIAQDEGSALIYGMPRAAVESGCVDAVVPLARIPETILACLRDPIAYREWVGYAS